MERLIIRANIAEKITALMEMTIVTHFLDDEMKKEGHAFLYYDNLIQKEI